METSWIQQARQKVETVNILTSNSLSYLCKDGNIVYGVDELRNAMKVIHELQDLLKDR